MELLLAQQQVAATGGHRGRQQGRCHLPNNKCIKNLKFPLILMTKGKIVYLLYESFYKWVPQQGFFIVSYAKQNAES